MIIHCTGMCMLTSTLSSTFKWCVFLCTDCWMAGYSVFTEDIFIQKKTVFNCPVLKNINVFKYMMQYLQS